LVGDENPMFKGKVFKKARTDLIELPYACN
jgi:hypothetical protein